MIHLYGDRVSSQMLSFTWCTVMLGVEELFLDSTEGMGGW